MKNRAQRPQTEGHFSNACFCISETSKHVHLPSNFSSWATQSLLPYLALSRVQSATTKGNWGIAFYLEGWAEGEAEIGVFIVEELRICVEYNAKCTDYGRLQ